METLITIISLLLIPIAPFIIEPLEIDTKAQPPAAQELRMEDVKKSNMDICTIGGEI